MITHKELLQLLDYNAATGAFTWRVRRGHVLAGTRAGYYDADGYIRIKLAGKEYRAARLAWFYVTRKWPKGEVDHVDRVRDNNAFDNLNDGTKHANLLNKNPYRKNKTGVKNVRERSPGKWSAQITRGGVVHYFGTYNTLEEAALAAYTGELKLNGASQ